MTAISRLARTTGIACVLLFLWICWTTLRVSSTAGAPAPATLRTVTPVVAGTPRPDILVTIARGGQTRAVALSGTETRRAGQQIRFAIANADGANHALSIPQLGLFAVVGRARTGAPEVATVTVTPRGAGRYTWYVLTLCSGGPRVTGRIVVR